MTQDLNQIVDIILSVSPQGAPRSGFNQGLIVGPSTIISATERLRLYQNIADMLTDGFLTTSAEYLAAQLYVNTIAEYFGAGAAYNIWIGRQDLTTGGLWDVAVNAGGTGYQVGDVLLVSGGTGGSVIVTSISGGGSAGPVTGINVDVPGTGYTVTAAEATTGGTGTGCTVNITAIGESPLVALQACRAASSEWYLATVTDAAKSDIEAIGAWIQSATPSSCYFYTTSDADCITTAGTDIGTILSALTYDRMLGQYSTENANAVAAIMGYAMGANTGLAGSAYTLAFKSEIGVTVEPVNASAVTNLKNHNLNVYLNYGNFYNVFQDGRLANGRFFDERLNLDMLGNNIQLNIMDLLYSVPKIPQTDGGSNQTIHVIEQAVEQSVSQGFIAPGIWRGQPVLGVKTGQTLPAGYLVIAPPYSQQTDADRLARKSVPFYVLIAEAGAVHSIVVQVNVAE